MSPSAQERVKDLLEDLSALKLDETFDSDSFGALLSQRQEIIDQLSGIDESLAVVRETIAGSPELQKLLDRVADLDRQLLDQATAHKEQLRAALSNTGRGLHAARGYRLHIPSSPAIIDKKA